jgi:predicted signal transduction protein with EAL and GGDEF domain
LRPGDVVARFGGDEFVLLVQAQNEIEARVISARIQSCAREPISLNGRDYSASLSIGIAMGTGAGQTSADLLRDADAAMYRAKATGKGRSVVFDYWMRDEAMLRMDLVADLRFALANYQLHVFYQPIVDLTTGIPTSVEALVRWEHPTKGLIKPDVFIPLAEEHDLIGVLDEFVLQEACTVISSIRASQPFLENLCVAVNISGRHIADHGLVERVASVLAQTHLAPECLTLELTESTLMKDIELSTRALTKLKELGIRLSIDDFGTGYSSLSYLQNFPLDCLKVDRSFTARLGRDDDSEPIVRATISIAQALGLEIVAEGIEDLEQAEFLRDAGCQKAQGYLFSRPVSKQSLVSTLLGLTVSAVS